MTEAWLLRTAVLFCPVLSLDMASGGLGLNARSLAFWLNRFAAGQASRKSSAGCKGRWCSIGWRGLVVERSSWTAGDGQLITYQLMQCDVLAMAGHGHASRESSTGCQSRGQFVGHLRGCWRKQTKHCGFSAGWCITSFRRIQDPRLWAFFSNNSKSVFDT